MSEKNYTLTLKTIGCGRKCQFFNFCCVKSKSDFRNRLNASFQVHIFRTPKNPRFSSWYGVIDKIKISSSGRYHCISVYFRLFRHFRLPVTPETTLSTRTRRFPIACKKPFDDTWNLWPVIWYSDLGNLKKAP